MAINVFNAEKRLVRGVATNNRVDKVGDTIDAKGVTFERSVPILAYHKADAPIGIMRSKRLVGDDWVIEAELLPEGKSATADEVWAAIQLGAVAGFSIGFRPQTGKPNAQGGIDYSKVLVHEVSAVTFPCNPDAIIAGHSNAKHVTPAEKEAERKAAALAYVKSLGFKSSKECQEEAAKDHTAHKLGFLSHADRVKKLAAIGIKLG
ncbi:HK97 family phage prohead protease [Paraburkholderia hospita]|uniref:HK97 family phage prohead protease n=1 Tax=Paraburkholderia hospita TaxID=169430 RepID=UPI000B34963D|nr:HK97 family phage prohead protease [Paraburkholderia hospita]OUL71616.1 hypothetical protein CA603_46790 [Paraburkholderia hospita]